MKILIASLLSIIFLFLSGIHVYWGFGGKTSSSATVPTNLNNKPIISPSPFSCFVVATGLFTFGAFVLIKAGVVLSNLPGWILNYGLWAISLLFLIRAVGDFRYIGFFKKIKNTKFGLMDTKYYSPLCLLIACLGIVLEFTS